MSQTSDGLAFDRVGHALSVHQTQHGDNFSYIEGEDLTVSQLYCLTNKEECSIKCVGFGANGDKAEKVHVSEIDRLSCELNGLTSTEGDEKGKELDNSNQSTQCCDKDKCAQNNDDQLMTVSQLHNMLSAAQSQDRADGTLENGLTVSQLYSLTSDLNENQVVDEQSVCVKDLRNEERLNVSQVDNDESSNSKLEGTTAGQCTPHPISEIVREKTGAGDMQLQHSEAASPPPKYHSSEALQERRKIVSATSVLDQRPTGSDLIQNKRTSYHGSSTEFGKFDRIPTEGSSSETCDGRVSFNEASDLSMKSKLLTDNPIMEGLSSKGKTFASSSAPGANDGDRNTLCNKNDNCHGQLSSGNDCSSTCLGKGSHNNTVQEISDLLEKCEYLLHGPSEHCDENNSEKVELRESPGSDRVQKERTSICAENSDTCESSQTMGTTNSSEKLGSICERSKLQGQRDDIKTGRNYESADLEMTFDKSHQHRQGVSKSHTHRNEGSEIKGTILPNAANSLFGQTDTSGSIQGNYEPSHQITGNVSHEFNHLGKHGHGWDLATDITIANSAAAVVPESQKSGSLTCSENTDEDQSDKKFDQREILYKQSQECNDSPVPGLILKTNEGQGRKSGVPGGQIEGHTSSTAKDCSEVTMRKDILRSPKLRSPKMSPMLRDRRFRHGTAGSADSGSCSDPESIDSQRSEDSDEDDEDAGIYGESHRHSKWLYCGENEDLTVFAIDIDIDGKGPEECETALDISGEDQSYQSETSCGIKADQSQDSGLELTEDYRNMPERAVDADVSEFERTSTWGRALARRKQGAKRHHRTESISTTASELEFRNRYQARTRKLIQRQCSQQAYQRMSERFYENERTVILEKTNNESTFGFHIKGSQPVVISTLEEGSIAQRSQLCVGDVLLAVNDVSVMDATHQEIIKLMSQDLDRVQLVVAADRVFRDEPVCSGYLIKQGGSGPFKNWRRRWFILKDDHCLYYYKTDKDADPLGAILLTNYTITKAPEISKKHAFKAVKYGQRSYLFQAESEVDMNRWANVMSAAATTNTKTDTWLDISSHNVGLSALSIKQPDCHGYLTKMGNRRKTWKRRYCVLKDACLYYYLDVNSTTAQGVAHLHGYTVDDSLPTSRKNGITLHPPEQGMRTFYFSSENETDKKRWLRAFRSSIGRWVRADDL